MQMRSSLMVPMPCQCSVLSCWTTVLAGLLNQPKVAGGDLVTVVVAAIPVMWPLWVVVVCLDGLEYA